MNDKDRLEGIAKTVVARWMGKQGWTPAEAEHAFSKLKVAISPNTLRTQMGWGRGQVLPVPSMPAALAKKLKALKKGAAK